MEWLALVMFLVVIAVLLLGYPVAFTLGGVALLFAGGGMLAGEFDAVLLQTFASRIYGIMRNETLIAVPLFVLMGVILERTRMAEELLGTMAELFGRVRGGLGYSVLIVGALLAASTGIVGATVVTMGLLSLPSMLNRGYDPALAAGTISAAGTLGQIIPPSIILVLLGDVISTAWQESQRLQGSFSATTVSISDLFLGALLPGLLLVASYALYLALVARFQPARMPMASREQHSTGRSLQYRVWRVLLPPLLLMLLVLGSIIAGVATPTEAAAVGAAGALLLAFIKREVTLVRLRDSLQGTLQITSMVFLILIGASLFSLVFRGFRGDELVHQLLGGLPGGAFAAMLLVMLLMFVLGFVLDFIEITFVVVPIVGPVLLGMGIDPVWLGVMIALNLQTSFLTPPFGFSLFYLRGVAPESVSTRAIYRGALPFVAIQLLMLCLVAAWPELASALPAMFG